MIDTMAMFSARRRIASQTAARRPSSGVVPLGQGRRGLCGTVVYVGPDAHRGPGPQALGSSGPEATAPRAPAATARAIGPGEIERRLLEMGFVEGARVEILHEGAIGRDPIGVRLDDTRIALRRREADFVLVRVERVGVGRAAEARVFADAAE